MGPYRDKKVVVFVLRFLRRFSDKYEKSNGVRKRQKKSLKSQCGQASLYLLIRWKKRYKGSIRTTT
jgi:hypothetical protein